MKRQKLRIILKLFYSLLGVLITTTNSHATWSIIAVDRTTGEVGIAGASCTYNVQGIGRSIPGKGVVVVQAKSNSNARKLGIKLMGEGVNPEQIIEAIRDKQFDPENQQYGVVVLYNDIAPATYSGKRISNWKGVMVGDDVAVLGNTLVDEKVVSAAFEAFNAARDKDLSERLMLALEAGEKAGGDKRCGIQHATSAFVTVYNSNDDKNSPYLNLSIYGIEKGGQSAVTLLTEEYEHWSKLNRNNQSTEVYIIP